MYRGMYRVILSGVEVKPMLLVVNIVTSPIGTDCGWSAPVVGLYKQAEGFLKRKSLYMYKLHCKTCKCHLECHINCMRSHSYNLAR